MASKEMSPKREAQFTEFERLLYLCFKDPDRKPGSREMQQARSDLARNLMEPVAK